MKNITYIVRILLNFLAKSDKPISMTDADVKLMQDIQSIYDKGNSIIETHKYFIKYFPTIHLFKKFIHNRLNQRSKSTQSRLNRKRYKYDNPLKTMGMGCRICR